MSLCASSVDDRTLQPLQSGPSRAESYQDEDVVNESGGVRKEERGQAAVVGAGGLGSRVQSSPVVGGRSRRPSAPSILMTNAAQREVLPHQARNPKFET